MMCIKDGFCVSARFRNYRIRPTAVSNTSRKHVVRTENRVIMACMAAKSQFIPQW